MARRSVKKEMENRPTDDFIEEIEEELRQKRLLALWQRWAVPALIAAFFVVVSVFGWYGYKYIQTQTLVKNSEEFFTTIEKNSDKNFQDTQSLLNTLDNNTAYQLSSQSYLISKALQEDNKAEATKLYDDLIAMADLQDSHRFAFILQAAALNVGEDAFLKYETELINRSSLETEDNYYRYLALELLALNDFAHGKTEDAQQKILEIIQAANTFPELRNRANIMLSFINNSNEQS